jgi:hypothetical protein
MLAMLHSALTILKIAAKFVAAFFAMTVICTIAWLLLVDGRLYNSTDGFPGYLMPGDWAYNWDGVHPVRVVAHVVVDGNMNHSDTIKEGWTNTRLWYLWYFSFSTTVIISTLLAWVRWPLIGLLNAIRSHAGDRNHSLTK